MKKNKIARVFHFDLHGTRDQKYEFLNQNSISTINWTELETAEPNNFFVKKDFTGSGQYEEGFKIDEFFKEYNNGIETGKDAFFYSFKKNELINKIVTAFQNKNETIRKY
ncbi:MAG: DNA methyltransferase, partial [Candidatus Delongbacteria bacterium]|nr:DNA methyltransferase [Candidatus Delongbacteria bacterium]